MHRKNANQPCAWTGGSSSENRMSASNKVIGNDVSEKRKFRTDSQVVMLPPHSKMRTKFSERSISESLKGNFCQKRPTNQIAFKSSWFVAGSVLPQLIDETFTDLAKNEQSLTYSRLPKFIDTPMWAEGGSLKLGSHIWVWSIWFWHHLQLKHRMSTIIGSLEWMT
jgi:hypothetical protein